MLIKDFKELSKIEYNGNLNKYQEEGNKLDGKKVYNYEPIKLTPYQDLLYKRALHGLRMYDQKEINSMHKQKIYRIKKVYSKTQKIINLMKQEKANEITNKFFELWFPKSSITKSLLEIDNFTSSKVFNTMKLKELDITKVDIIERLIQEKILPSDFYTRTEIK